jgi:nucleoside-diphosphate-sugar epimerase
VTGTTGFVGNEIINQLIKTDNIIIATAIEEANIVKKRFDWFSNVLYIQKDLDEKEENYFRFFNQPDMLIHLSWANLPNYKELFHIEKNLMSNYSFIKSLVTNGIKDVVCIGTCFEYGMQNGPLTEDINTKPCTLYGLAKDTLRKFIEELQKRYKFNFRWLRLFYPYGKGQSPTSLLSQLDRAISNNENIFNMSGGEQLRDYLHIEKVAEYIIECSLQNRVQGIINICSGKPVSVRSFVENYLKEKNITIKLNLGHYPYPDYEPMAFWGDKTRLNSVLGSFYESKD